MMKIKNFATSDQTKRKEVRNKVNDGEEGAVKKRGGENGS